MGTGSLRRRAQLLHYRRNLDLVPIRGNVDTRLRKLDAGEVDGLIMAAAGLNRIGRTERITEYLSEEICVSAVAQGALGLEARAADSVAEEISFLHDAATYACVSAERAFLRRLGGGCLVPVGARAKLDNDKIELVGVVAAPDGAVLVRGQASSASADCEALGRDLAERVLAQGADKILGRS
jgi:hydroxymethylbilane synthase